MLADFHYDIYQSIKYSDKKIAEPGCGLYNKNRFRPAGNSKKRKRGFFMKNEDHKAITEPDKNMAQEEMTVELELEEGTVICSVVTIFSVGDEDYIALLPLDENNDNTDGTVWIYGYSENPENPNEEPVLRYIDDDEEYEQASDAFDEFLDQCEFDEIL